MTTLRIVLYANSADKFYVESTTITHEPIFLDRDQLRALFGKNISKALPKRASEDVQIMVDTLTQEREL